MKDPKALFPFIFITSWLGNLLLTVLAFYLAFTQEGPLSPFTLLTVAACILAGNLLPISAYLVFVYLRRAELQAETAEASVRVREALQRSEEVTARLDEAEGALSKAILIARQVPERITGKFQLLEDLSAKLDTMEVDSFTEAIQAQGRAIDNLNEEMGVIRAAISEMKEDLGGIPQSLDRLIKESLPNGDSSSHSELNVSIDERLDIVFESLESVQDSLDGLLQRISGLNIPAPSPLSDSTESPDSSNSSTSPDRSESLDSPAPSRHKTDAQGELVLVEEAPQATEGVETVKDGKVRLNVQAMIGISNKLYIRGDEPGLSWDAGQPMELVGIGEFAWEMDDLKEPMEVSVFLNDELESEAGRLTLEPGKPVRVSLSFPHR